MTLRALRILREVDWIACEDTRHTAKLLNHFQIKKKCMSFYKPREAEQARKIFTALEKGQSIALVSDAGSPALSDPGEQLVHNALKSGFRVEAIPGATALIPALTGSGFPTAPFVFLGFPPRNRSRLAETLTTLEPFSGMLIFYKSPQRIAAFCRVLSELIGDQPAQAVKEISKVHETRYSGTLSQLAEVLTEQTPQGEWVLLVHKPGPGQAESLQLETIEDIYNHFQIDHGLSKNHVRKIIQTRKNR